MTVYEQKYSNIKYRDGRTIFVIKTYFNWYEINHIVVDLAKRGVVHDFLFVIFIKYNRHRFKNNM